jgi:hypothetical protein
MKTFVLICLSIAVFISSCQKGENVFGNIISIKLPLEAINIKEIAESEKKYFSSTEYVQLESKEDIHLGKIDKILITENRIYILDIFKYGGVIIYDREGKIVNAIDRRGPGPEEYNYIFGIFHDQQDSTINLLCQYPNKIMKFDQDGYHLIKQVELPVALIDIKKSPDGYYAGYAGSSSINNSHSIYIFSEKFELIASQYPNHKEWQIYRMDNTLSSYSDNIYFTPMYGYTVYAIEEKSIVPLYVYDFGKNNISEAVFKDHEQYDKIDCTKYIDYINLFQETSKYLIASYIFQGSQIISFFNKVDKTNETFLAINNPISKLSFGGILAIDENHIITSIESYRIIHTLENPEAMEQLQEGIDMLKNAMRNPVNEDDDPVLCIYHIKP